VLAFGVMVGVKVMVVVSVLVRVGYQPGDTASAGRAPNAAKQQGLIGHTRLTAYRRPAHNPIDNRRQDHLDLTRRIR